MQVEFVPYEIALKLKKLGFNEPCIAKYIKYNKEDKLELFPVGQNFFDVYFNKNFNEYIAEKEYCTAPLWQQAFEYFRDKGIYSIVTSHLEPWGGDGALIESFGYKYFYNKDGFKCEVVEKLKSFDSYEEARLKCLEKLIELCKTL